jgi:hypothetical protein
MTGYHADDADWTVLSALQATYDAFRDNYIPFVGTAMVWLLPVFVLDALGAGNRLQTSYQLLVGAILLMGMAPSVAESLLGHPVVLRECLAMTVTKLRPNWPALALILVFATGGAFVLLILPGLYLMTAWSVAAPVMAAEKVGVTPALRRSMRLTRGRMWRVLTVLLIYGTVAFFLVMGSKVLAATIAGPEASTWPTLISFLITAVLTALTPCLTTVLYCLLRFEREGMTLELVSDTLH